MFLRRISVSAFLLLTLLLPELWGWDMAHTFISEAAYAVQPETLKSCWSEKWKNPFDDRERLISEYLVRLEWESGNPDHVASPSAPDIKRKQAIADFVYAEIEGRYARPAITCPHCKRRAYGNREDCEFCRNYASALSTKPWEYHYFNRTEAQNRELAVRGGEWYFQKMGEAFRAKNYARAAQFAGSLAHALEDRCSPFHAWEGYQDERLELEKKHRLTEKFWVPNETGMNVDIQGYLPHALGSNIPAAALGLAGRIDTLGQYARGIYATKFLEAHLTDNWEKGEAGPKSMAAMEEAATEGARRVADMFYTGYLLSQEKGSNMAGSDIQALGSGSALPLIKNADFEDGLASWSCQYPEPAYKEKPCRIDSGMFRSGTNSLCLALNNPYVPVTVNQVIPEINPGRYEFSGFFKVTPASKAGGIVFYVDAAADFHWDKFNVTVVRHEEVGDGWFRKTIRFQVFEKKTNFALGVSVPGMAGSVWLDSFSLSTAPSIDNHLVDDGLWYSDVTLKDKDGMEPRRRFHELQRINSPFIVQARRYNDFLSSAALLQDALAQTVRAAFYLGYDAARYQKQSEALDKIYGLFDAAERQLTSLYQQKLPELLEKELKPRLAEIEGLLAGLRKELAQEQKALSDLADKKDPARMRIKAAEKKPYRMASDGRPNQPLFGTWGKYEFKETLQSLPLWRYTWSQQFTGMAPTNPGYWKDILENFERQKEKGAKHFGVTTDIMGQGPWLDPNSSFCREHQNDPKYKKGAGWNLWAPEVQAEQKAVINRITDVFRGKDGVLFYTYMWEYNPPPKVTAEASADEKYFALQSFRSYLKKKYGSIDQLNKDWGAQYRDFSDVEIPPKKLLESPASYTYELWWHDAYYDFLKEVYNTFKSGDPNTPVLANPASSLMRFLDPTRFFEVADIVCTHTTYPANLNQELYLAHNWKLYGKVDGKFENHNMLQEDMFRVGEERALYAVQLKLMYRMALMGMKLQTWAFPATSQPGWRWRIGQWCQLQNDYLTMRYFAGAFPVGMRRIEKMGDIFLDLHPAPADILLVFPRASWLHTSQHVRFELEALVPWFYFSGRPFDYKNEADILDGKAPLDRYKVIILPQTYYFNDGFAKLLISWISHGGTLISFGPAGILNKYGQKDTTFMQQVAGFMPEVKKATYAPGGWGKPDPWLFEYPGKPGGPILEFTFDKGKYCLVTPSLNDLFLSCESVKQLLATIDAAAPDLPRTENNNLELWPLEDSHGKTYLGAINSNVDVPVEAKVMLPGKITKVADIAVLDGFPIMANHEGGKTVFKTRLEPGGMALFQLE